jgi:Zn-dependent peptidase ImmA (M78 family)/DNA-binding XRE family transcriptional regulator
MNSHLKKQVINSFAWYGENRRKAMKNILDTVDMRRLGRELQRARQKQGLTQAAAAKIIGVARTTLTAIEKGERRIKANELAKLAEAYGQLVSDFVRPRPEIEPFQVQFRSTHLRTGEDDVRIIESLHFLEELCRNYLELEQLTNKPLVRNYPPVYQYKGMRTEPAAQGLAIAERNRLGLGDGPIPILRNVLEQNVGLRIFYLPLKPSSKISEIYSYDHTLGGCIAINSKHLEERRRWSLSHGYAHFLADRYKPRVLIQDQYQRVPESERFADNFARYFLMPTNALTQRFNAMYQEKGRITPADLIKLAHYYGVSLQAMIYRLEDMRLIPSGIWEKLYERGFRVREAREQLGLGEIPAQSDKLPIGYQKLAVSAYYEGKISEGQLAHLLQTDRLEARRIASEPKWYVTESSISDPIDHDLMELARI